MSDPVSFIPLSVPHIRGNELKYVSECIETEWVSSAGAYVDRFEREFAEFVGSPYAVACSSGTAALHVALLLAGVGPGDLVAVPTLTFVATVNAIRYCGAEPLFIDCDEFYNGDFSQLADFLASGEAPRVKALLPVHVFGNAVPPEPLVALARKLGVPIIEDAAESLGTRYLHGAGHSGTIGLFGCFSFNGNKVMTTGGGGMLVCADAELARKARYLTTQAKDDEVRFVHHEVGFNYRLTNLQAALGCAQLEQLPRCLDRKREIFQGYRRALAGVSGIRIADVPPYASNNHWMPCLQVNAAEYGEDREQLMARLARAGIQSRPVWELNHRQRPFRSFRALPSPRAERLHACTLNIPCSSGLTDEQQQRVVRELRRE